MIRRGDVDEELAASAIRETEAQLAILSLLRPLNRETRTRIMRAAALIIAAEEQVPGILARYLKDAPR